MTKKWHLRFLELAKFISLWSKDPSCKVGAVIADKNKKIISVGYNGFPKNVKDLKSRYKNREYKLEAIIHAEINAILHAKENLTGYYLYTYPFMPCGKCSSLVIESGIKCIIAPKWIPNKWKDSCNLAKCHFKEAKVKVMLI